MPPASRLAWLAVLFFPLVAEADAFIYDDSGRLTDALQSNGLTHVYGVDAEASVLSAMASGADSGNGLADWWENFYFGTTGVNPLGSAAGDAISNLTKYALGLNPTTSVSAPLAAISQQGFEGQNYYFFTYTRSKTQPSMVSLEQSSNNVNWFGGSAYFAQVGSATDLGDGTEQVTFRNLTPIPAANSLTFRLVTNGGSPALTAYNNLSSGAGVPLLPWWGWVALVVALPLVARRFLSHRGAAAAVGVFLMAGSFLVCPGKGFAEVGPGWYASPRSSSPGSRALASQPSKPFASLASPPSGAQTRSLVPGPVAASVTPELEALATNLNDDPVAIYNFVRNKIRFQPYRGSCKGAHTTFLDGAGNDMDQASLLIALLNAAGYANTAYVYGQISVPDESFDEYDLSHWLGCRPSRVPWVLDYAATPGMSFFDFGSFLLWSFDHVWVRVTVAGTTYDLSPSFKTSELSVGVDCRAISGYSRSQLVTDAGTGSTVTTNSVRNVNRAALETRLGQYASTLRAYLRANLWNQNTEDILGGSGDIIERTASSLSNAADMLEELFPEVTTTYALLPANFQSNITVKVGTQIDATFNSDSLQSKRLSLVFSGQNAQLWLDDTMVASETNGSGTTANITLSVTHPDTTLSQSIPAAPYLRSGSYVITYAFYPNPYSNGQIAAIDAKLQDYLGNGLADTTRQVLTQSLHGIGQRWVRRAALGNDMVSKVNDCSGWTDHILGLTGQDTGYWVDMPAGLLTTFNDGASQAELTRSAEVFKASTLVSSAMEHGVIEQTGGSASLSTIKCLALANDAGQRIYRVTPSNWANISGQLNNYTAADLAFIATYATVPGNVSLVHANGRTVLNDWDGYGFAAMSSTFATMLIRGGYAGGYTSTPGLLSGSALDFFNGTLTEEAFRPTGVARAMSAEPVDLATGAYTMAATDLALGDANTPRGLALSRTYDSSRSSESSSLGRGWRHSCEGRIYLNADLDAGFGLRQPTDAVETIVAALALPDFADTTDPALELVVGALTANWLVDRITNNAANIQLGEQRMTYIRTSGGVWNPPPGSTTALVGTSGNFTLQPRFGGNVTFNAQNRVSQWRDVDNNAQSYAYDTQGRLATVTDSQNRVLTFIYESATSPLLDRVTDSTGRVVDYTITNGNLTGIKDVENYNTTLIYDTRKRLTEWRDHEGDLFVINFYDAQDRVYQQHSQGDANRLWKFFYSPGTTQEVDPLGNVTTHSFDAKNRRLGVTDALGNWFFNFYSAQNHVRVTINSEGQIQWFDYDANQNLKAFTDAAGKITRYDYDTSLRLWKITDATNRVTEYGYDAENHLKTVKDPGLRVTTFDYRPDGLLEKITDHDNKLTRFTTFDQWANPTTTIRPDNTTTSAVFTARGDLESYTDGRNKTTSFTYDRRRLLKTRTDARLKTTTWNYDSNGYVDDVIDRRNKTTDSVFDNFGKLQTLTSSDTGTVTYGYDFRDLQTTITDGLNHTTTTGYDNARRPNKIIDALNIVTSNSTYDGANRLKTNANGLNQTNQFFYDTAGRLQYTLDPLNRRIDHTYDDAGRPKTLKNRKSKTFTYDYAPDGLASTFTYPSARQSAIIDRDPVGRPETLQEPSGQQTILAHDAMGRLDTQTDQVGQIVWDYDNEGNPEFVTQGNATIARTFDNLNRVETCTDTSNNTVGYTYDDEGNLETLTYPGNRTVTYTYDGSNRLKTVTDWAQRLTTYFYDTAGRLERVERPNGTQQRIEYDAANRLQDTFEERGTTSLWQANYLFDDAYRLQTYTPTPPTRTYAPPPASMTYDDDNRLETYNGTSVPSDLDGNLRAAPLNGTLLGNLTWDARNRLLTAGNTTYTHDAENRRVSTATGNATTRYTWSRGASLDRLLVKQNADGSTTRYIHGLGLLYEETTPAGGGTPTTRYYHYNWQGSTMALSDQVGNVTARLSYSPYGEVTIVSGTPNTPFLFNGQFGVMTEPNGLYCMQARFYSPIFRRFLSEDPAGFSGGINLYAYTGGDPVNLMDPFGLGPMSALASIERGVLSVFDAVGITAFNNAFYWTLGEVGRGVEMTDNFLVSQGFDPMALPLVGSSVVGLERGLIGLSRWGRGLSAARVTPDTYTGIRQASQYLQEMGVSRADRVRYLQSFEPQNMVVRQAGQSEFGLRFFSDPARAGGQYLFETFPASRASLAIKPEWSTMAGFRQFQIRPGATLLEGRAAAQGPYLPGGQTQKFILDSRADLIAP